MKALFIGPKNSPDYLGSVLWDGMQELLGEDNVFDAVGSCLLHKAACTVECGPMMDIGAHRDGRWWVGERGIDLIVVISSFNRDFGWDYVNGILDQFPHAKVAYVEGWDSAHQIETPQMRVNATFRKEIAQILYPYAPHHLSFAVPLRWFEPLTKPRDIDVFFYGKPNTCHPGYPRMRWDGLSEVFRTKCLHNSVILTKDIGYDHYFSLLRRSKLGLCLAAADGADSLRTYEVAACGAIPVFVNHPPHIRDPWFPVCFDCTVSTLAAHIDEALSQHNMEEKRIEMWEHAKKHHTTVARAKKVVEVLFGATTSLQ